MHGVTRILSAKPQKPGHHGNGEHVGTSVDTVQDIDESRDALTGMYARTHRCTHARTCVRVQ
eukprot:6673740-Lingulodinium_polyedra.AAC.1